MDEKQRKQCEPNGKIKGTVKYTDGRDEEIYFQDWAEYSRYIDGHVQEIAEAHGEPNRGRNGRK